MLQRSKITVLILILLATVLWGPAVRAQQPAPAPAAPAHPNLPRVLLLATGGTIAAAGYAGQKQLTAADLVQAVPQIKEVANLTVEEPLSVGSSQITPQMLLDLAGRARKALADDPGLAGIVITQGTDSLEETSFFFDLALDTDKPVVFTAAMRLPTEIGADGPRNLLNAVRLAASPATRGLGVLVTLNDEIHAAREVRKTNSSATDAFESPGGGPLGYVSTDEIFLLRKPLRRVHIDTGAVEPRVDLIVATVGSDGHQVKAAVDAGAKGIVVELFGTGNAPGPMLQELLNAARKQVTVVFTTRTGGGPVHVSYPKLAEAGVINGRDVDGLKARMVLIAALSKTQDRATLQGWFDKLAGKV
jgi:L-asparaginase